MINEPNEQQAEIAGQVETVVRELALAGKLEAGHLLVIGVSTSEMLGYRIGTSGAVETAAAVYAGVEAVRKQIPFVPVYQCCEHLNRALVIEEDEAVQRGLEIVYAVPVPKAGGSMAAYAYGQFAKPCLVERLEAHAGVDIGDTFIGMHLKRVAVPVRPSIKTIGEAHVTMAITRPKLIGGARAVYDASSSLRAEQQAGTCE
ncbi:TIGR01440 family protein [Paenibacillus sp. 1011MAR3C5]|uniref:TIGR01440 family protein n=1 Tax=Paenibacillus sp. 1011MAR3C5 TaxID=1675787 RepID=UPI000E6BD9D6|nr:TIGR01440 family protein [Paenibacillus sp. 1011MAR3C5]RJE85567.1 TIGR01440 family protein [Paenibacillus sp. 1011MAR3C5]